MPKGSKRRSLDRYELFEGGERIPLPDYAMFRKACEEAGQELGINGGEVERVYRKFIRYSLDLLLPEKNPRSLPDEALLTPRRIMKVPGIASCEITKRSLWHWHKIEYAIRRKREETKLNNNT